MLLQKHLGNMCSATNELLLAVFALLMHLVADEVWALHRRREHEFTEEVDVGLGAITLVMGIVNELDSVEIVSHALSHDCGACRVIVEGLCMNIGVVSVC